MKITGKVFRTLTVLVIVAVLPRLSVAEFTSHSYIQRGLILHLDGIDNGGTGVHDPSITIWTNLACNSSHFTLVDTVESSSYGEHYGRWLGGNSLDVHKLAATRGNVACPSYKTIEAMFISTSSGLIMCGNSTTGYRRSIYSNGTKVFFDTNNNITPAVPCANSATIVRQVAGVYDGNLVSAAYSNGVEVLNYTAQKQVYKGNYAIGDRQVANGVDPWIGRVFTIRQYDRVLSPVELRYNACVDMVRFEGVEPSTLEWPTGVRYQNGELEFFVKVTATAGAGGTVTVTGIPAEGAWLKAGEKAHVVAAAANGKMLDGFFGQPMGTKTDDEGLVIEAMPGMDNLAINAVFTDEIWTVPLPARGLVADLDASLASTITKDGDGKISAWRSVVGNVVFTNDTAAVQPLYNTTTDSRGCVYFNMTSGKAAATSYLTADRPFSARTVLMVMQPVGQERQKYPWGADSTIPANAGSALETGVSVDGLYRQVMFAYPARNWVNGAVWSTKTSTTDQESWERNKTGAFMVEATEGHYQIYGCDRFYNIGSTSHGAGLRFVLMELLVWDRVLTDEERNYVFRAMWKKWKVLNNLASTRPIPASLKNDIKVWTGSANDGDWSNDANWSAGGRPQTNEVAVIRGADVTVNGDVSLPDAKLYMDGGSITVADTGVFELPKIGESIALTGAGTHHDWTFTLDGGTLALKDGVSYQLPATTTVADGSLFTGKGIAVLNGNLALDSISIRGSYIDLNGHDVTARSIAGGVITNSAPAVSTLTMASTTDKTAYLSGQVRKGVKLVRGGSDAQEFTLAGMIDGETELGADATRIATSECPVLEGCVLHLDATKLNSFVFGDNYTNLGQGTNDICEWHSIIDPSVCCKTGTKERVQLSRRPYYDPNAFNGMGGVRLKKDPYTGTNAWTRLYGNADTPMRTVFVICRQADGSSEGAGPIGHTVQFEAEPIYDDGWAYNADAWLLNPRGVHNVYWDFWINGERMCDYSGESVWYHPDVLATYEKENFKNRRRRGVYRYSSMDGVTGYKVRPVVSDVELLACRFKNGIYRDSNSQPVVRICLSDLPAYETVNNHTSPRHVFSGWIGEIILYDRLLTDGEFHRVQRYLYDKWLHQAKPRTNDYARASNMFAADETMTFAANAALDLGGTTQTVARASVIGDSSALNGTFSASALEIAYGTGSFASLALSGNWDLSGTALSFVGDGKLLGSGVLVTTTGVFIGPFASVEPASVASKLKIDAHKVRFGSDGLVIIVRFGFILAISPPKSAA